VICKIRTGNPIKSICFIMLSALCIVTCTRQITKQVTTEKDQLPVRVTAKGDTTVYVVGFTDKKEVKSFLRSFEHFVKEYSIDTIASDSVRRYFCFKFVALPKDTPVDSRHTLEKIERLDFVETDIKIPAEETIGADTAGTAVIYTDRTFIDNTLAELLSAVAFIHDSSSQKNADSSGLILKQLSPLKIGVTCTGKLVNNAAKQITSFDLVQSWTNFIRDNPAEGSALFLHVQGLKKFIRGEEGIIAGFSVLNEQTIAITLSRPDPFALQRLTSQKLFPAPLKNGRMYLKKKQENTCTISRNQHYPFTRSFLDECTIICGNDKNPIVSYSLNRYDLLFLYRKNDLAYARQSLNKNSELAPVSTDRYFVSLASESMPLRKYIAGLIHPLEIQTNTVKAEGEVIGEIELPAANPAPEKNRLDTPPAVVTPVVIIYNTGDPASTAIAEKILSDLSHAGLPCKLNGLNKRALESALLDRTYDIAVGWVSNKTISNTSEKLRLATLWFNNETNEAIRINQYYEKPLFTVHRYALHKKNIRLYKNSISGIYRTATE